jgi:hypothetical protein
LINVDELMAISNLPITHEDRASDQIIADCSLPYPRTFCNQQLARFAHVHVSDERAQKDWTKMTKYAVTRPPQGHRQRRREKFEVARAGEVRCALIISRPVPVRKNRPRAKERHFN